MGHLCHYGWELILSKKMALTVLTEYYTFGLGADWSGPRVREN